MILRDSIAICVTLCLSFCLAQASGVQAQTTYRWVDRDGKVNYSDQPPPANARSAEEKKLGAPNAIASGGPDYDTQVAVQGSPVTLYSSSDCVVECKLARDFLHDNGVPYSEKSLKTAEDAAAFRRATGSGDLLVPTLLVGTVAQKGYDDGAWRKLLVAAGYPLGGAGAMTVPR